MKSIFGEEIKDDPKKKTGQANGYAWTPGTGPKGETCGTCLHLDGQSRGRTFYKCGLMRKDWTHGRGTDILKRSPACRFWEEKE